MNAHSPIKDFAPINLAPGQPGALLAAIQEHHEALLAYLCAASWSGSIVPAASRDETCPAKRAERYASAELKMAWDDLLQHSPHNADELARLALHLNWTVSHLDADGNDTGLQKAALDLLVTGCLATRGATMPGYDGPGGAS